MHSGLLPRVKDDTRLGSTSQIFRSIATPRSPQLSRRNLQVKFGIGTMEVAAVDHGSAAFLSSPMPAWDFRQKNGETGLAVSRPRVGQATDGRVQVTFNNVANWFLRFLGVYFQFVDANGKVIPKDQLPSDVLPDVNPSFKTLDRVNALYAGVITPVYSIACIPCYPPGDASILVNLPTQAATVNAFYTGLGLSGSQYDPTRLTEVGKRTSPWPSTLEWWLFSWRSAFRRFPTQSAPSPNLRTP